MNFYFTTIDGTVHLDARVEDDDVIGDAHFEVAKGEEFYGIGYDELVAAGNGVVEVEGNKGRIVDNADTDASD